MRKIDILIVLFLILLLGCKEEESPDGPYGMYEVESIISSFPVDFMKTGQQTTEHIEGFSWCSTSKFSISWGLLSGQTPVMDIYNFIFIETIDEITREKEIIMGCGLARRIVNLRENGNFEIRFWGGEVGSLRDPNQLQYMFDVLSLEYFQLDKKIRMVTKQVVYDFTLEKFVEVEMTYWFDYSGPLSYFSRL
jgi:hypothetical protein